MFAAALFAVYPAGLHGIWVRAKAGAVRDRWLERLRSLLPAEMPFGKLPLNASNECLSGGMDLTATLASARPVWWPGLLARLNDGVLMIPLADRLSQALSAQLGMALDDGAKDAGKQDARSAHFHPMLHAVAFDESEPDELPVASALRDRLAFDIDLSGISIGETGGFGWPPRAPAFPLHAQSGRLAAESQSEGKVAALDAADIAAARALLAGIETPDAILAALCRVSIELGIASLRAPLLAVAAAKACAALSGRDEITVEDAAMAARFVLAARATAIPMNQKSQADDQDRDGDAHSNNASGDSGSDADAGDIADIILAAARAALPADILSRLPKGLHRGLLKTQGGRSGAARTGGQRGCPFGVRRARSGHREKISAIDTIRAATPWQAIRGGQSGGRAVKFHVRQDDIRVRRYKSFAQTTTIFAVDASGSAALERLSEAKGAVELLLADCYIRRDQVALIAFRGDQASMLLPPTRSLTRAKRALNALAGGGGTPLAAGIGAASALAAKTKRNGGFPVVVLLTDGRANISAQGIANRESAHADALKIARVLRKSEIPSLLVDTSPRPQPKAGQLAQEMGALYLPLPYAGASSISAAARFMGMP